MAMATRFSLLCLALCLAVQTTRAEKYFVGDDLGWTFTNDSSGLPVDYTAWASKYTFFKDDVLVFNYSATQQNIYTFDTYDGWQNCNFSKGFMLDNGNNGTSEWILTAEGHYEFASAMFCHQGQKFSIYAVDPQLLITQVTSGSTAPAPAPAAAIGPATAPLSSNSSTPTLAPPKPATPGLKPATPPPPPSASAPAIVTHVLMMVVACATVSVMHSFL
ncbi:hypothetical protein MPTK1_4g01520 [Marchantia polymorpha subsp. ruderalis]|nr:hypothetical protein MARPO_0098s0048 [Marchantia polymorpha]BBN07158.1 hypothetical protein Mp_4g01520 [Marchantia polymorpha subsp. ruderalis]|eukprot:PTQ32501.1 hypothetical protein MARPO_0098s0048 [Marchantia polymorpha]